MIVLKFGGTSVGEPGPFVNACRQVQRHAASGAVAVVSALSGVTNLLVEYARHPDRREALSARLVARHLDFARQVRLDPIVIQPLLDEWQELSVRTVHEPPAVGAARDELLAFGERLSSVLFAAGLTQRGVAARAWHAGEAGLVTDEHFGAAHPLPEARERLRANLLGAAELPVVTGFLGATREGRTTTLGRGGSDYSAAIIGAALEAGEIQIWTDTSGLLSADPRIVPEARVVPELSFVEASELAYFGARVLHPKTLLPAIERSIPVRILNTARPDDPGSRIMAGASGEARWRVKSIASKKAITAVTIASTRMLLAHGFLARVFEVFGRHQIVVDLVTTSEVSISVTVDDATHLAAAIADLEGIGHVEVREGLAVVAVVGEGAPTHVGLPGHVFTLLGGVGIGVEMISQGASRVNLSFVVREADADRSVRLLHRGLGLDAEPLEEPAAAGSTSERHADRG